jgi:arylsulfatase A-like enzyme
VQMIHEHRPQVLFIHFPGDDAAGHGIGWGSPQQLTAVAGVDHGVGLVLAALDEEDLADSTLVIVSADHGGAGRSHGPGDARSRTIPWIARGPGIRQGYDLTQNPGLTVNTEDTFATACTMLGLSVPAKINGKFVADIVERRGELMHDVR